MTKKRCFNTEVSQAIKTRKHSTRQVIQRVPRLIHWTGSSYSPTFPQKSLRKLLRKDSNSEVETKKKNFTSQ